MQLTDVAVLLVRLESKVSFERPFSYEVLIVISFSGWQKCTRCFACGKAGQVIARVAVIVLVVAKNIIAKLIFQH